MSSMKVKYLKRLLALGFIALALVLVSCPNPSSSPTIQTILWQLDGQGFVQFLTNDSQYYNYIFWNTYTQESEPTMTTVTATVVKESGSQYSGYGIVFCYQDSNDFYRLLIDAAGQYSVYKRVSGTYSAIVPWTTSPSPHLASGIGASNVISVTRTVGAPGSFSINFNGTLEVGFSDSSFPGGKAGFAASVYDQNHENFPNAAEDVRFRMTSPVAYP